METLDLGMIDFHDAFALQERLAAEVAADAAPETLLLLEHPPVYTIGSGGDEANVLDPGHTGRAHQPGRGCHLARTGAARRLPHRQPRPTMPRPSPLPPVPGGTSHRRCRRFPGGGVADSRQDRGLDRGGKARLRSGSACGAGSPCMASPSTCLHRPVRFRAGSTRAASPAARSHRWRPKGGGLPCRWQGEIAGCWHASALCWKRGFRRKDLPAA